MVKEIPPDSDVSPEHELQAHKGHQDVETGRLNARQNVDALIAVHGFYHGSQQPDDLALRFFEEARVLDGARQERPDADSAYVHALTAAQQTLTLAVSTFLQTQEISRIGDLLQKAAKTPDFPEIADRILRQVEDHPEVMKELRSTFALCASHELQRIEASRIPDRKDTEIVREAAKKLGDKSGVVILSRPWTDQGDEHRFVSFLKAAGSSADAAVVSRGYDLFLQQNTREQDWLSNYATIQNIVAATGVQLSHSQLEQALAKTRQANNSHRGDYDPRYADTLRSIRRQTTDIGMQTAVDTDLLVLEKRQAA